MRLLDGAIGTQLQALGFELNAPNFAIAANTLAPALVHKLHRDYADSGAKELTLNSFGLSGGLDLEDPEFETALARRAGSAVARAQGIPGPSLSASLCISKDPEPETRLLAEAKAMLKAGVRHLRVETIVDTAPLKALRGALLPELLAHQATLAMSLCPLKHSVTEQAASLQGQGWLLAKNMVAIGINCVPMDKMQDAVEPLVQWMRDEGVRPTLSIELRPHLSAGDDAEDWKVKAVPPEAFATWAQTQAKFLERKSRWRVGIGTCCGGGPEHIEALRDATASPRL